MVRYVTRGLYCTLTILLMSCEKENTVWVFRDETACAEPWPQSSNATTLEGNIRQYIQDEKQIKVYEITITNEASSEACKACFCKTGRRIKVNVQEEDAGRIEAIGFSRF